VVKLKFELILLMAKQVGEIRIKGTIDGISFYPSVFGDLVRMKGGVSRKRFKKDPAFQQARENSNEFGMASKYGKLFRTELQELMLNASDPRISLRINQLMVKLKELDTTGTPGARNPWVGCNSPLSRDLLKNFCFRLSSMEYRLLHPDINIHFSNGTTVFHQFCPRTHLTYPTGTTHITITAAFGSIDLISNTLKVTKSNPIQLSIDDVYEELWLIPLGTQTTDGTKLYFLKIEFLTQANDNMNPLQNGEYDSLRIVEVA
jgi:hypothetical protein